MNESVDIEAVRAEALRKLGRNIVNFSKIEAAFKYLLSVSQLEGDGKTISAQLRRNQTRLRKQTFGKLVQEFNNNILGDASQSEPISDFSGAGISLSFKVNCNNPDFLKVQKRKLSSIVAERNKLIHQELAFIDTSSVEDYHNLITLLDEQNPRLLAQLEELKWMIETLRESLKVFEDLSKSPDFLQSIQSNQSNA
ncbi:hypothetical protein H6F78_04765 [Coleofasciculus sp. FACHB-64]|uniref:hypothetical protein n=1 Tax=Cyanophyceae TaxID=3028117 RepID=UPI001684B6EF|nr:MULTISPECIES: hypothetical protein [unclassified Coleofasciculus]MBD1840060.1 hypothetical protein [Coleofasciculus sp. FACHB-501]MBD1892226.1 hypothetical protein [Coleofasciculus sp. FACHB-SPT9]MBD2044951.1 hypothetical protein [Coleofasciculus sp. FACHB-64]